MGFLRQEYWSGLPFPPPGDLLDPGMEPASPLSSALAGEIFTTGPPEKPITRDREEHYNTYTLEKLGGFFSFSLVLKYASPHNSAIELLGI